MASVTAVFETCCLSKVPHWFCGPFAEGSCSGSETDITYTNINIKQVQMIKFTVPSLVFRKVSDQCWHNSTVVDMVLGFSVLLEKMLTCKK